MAFWSFRSISKRWILVCVIGLLLAAQTVLSREQVPGLCAEILFLFLAGSALYRLRILLLDFPGTWVATAGLLLFMVAVSEFFSHAIGLIYLAFALLIFGLSYDGGWLSKLLSQRPVVYGGVISYSMYMTHAVVLKFTDAAFHKLGVHSQGQLMAGALFFVSMVFMTASVFYHLIEAPCNNALRKHSPFGPAPSSKSASSARGVSLLDNAG